MDFETDGFSVKNEKLTDDEKLKNAIIFLKHLDPKEIVNNNHAYRALFFWDYSYFYMIDIQQQSKIILENKG